MQASATTTQAETVVTVPEPVVAEPEISEEEEEDDSSEIRGLIEQYRPALSNNVVDRTNHVRASISKIQSKAAFEAEQRAEAAETKFLQARKNKRDIERRLREFEQETRTVLITLGTSEEGISQRKQRGAKRRELQAELAQSNRSVESLFYDMQLARQAMRQLEEQQRAEQRAELVRMAARQEAAKLAKKSQDEAGRVQRVIHSRYERIAMEEARKAEEQALSVIATRLHAANEQQTQRQKREQLEVAAKKLELEGKTLTKRTEALTLLEAHQSTEEHRIKVEEENIKRLRDQTAPLQRKVTDSQRKLAMAREKFANSGHAAAREDHDEDILKSKHALHHAEKDLKRAQDVVAGRDAAVETRRNDLAKHIQDSRARIEKETLEQTDADHAEIRLFEATHRKSDWEAQLVVEELERERMLRTQKIVTLSKQIKMSQDTEKKLLDSFTPAQHKELARLSSQ